MGGPILPQPQLGTSASFWGTGVSSPCSSLPQELGDASLCFQGFVFHCSAQLEGFAFLKPEERRVARLLGPQSAVLAGRMRSQRLLPTGLCPQHSRTAAARSSHQGRDVKYPMPGHCPGVLQVFPISPRLNFWAKHE